MVIRLDRPAHCGVGDGTARSSYTGSKCTIPHIGSMGPPITTRTSRRQNNGHSPARDGHDDAGCRHAALLGIAHVSQRTSAHLRLRATARAGARWPRRRRHSATLGRAYSFAQHGGPSLQEIVLKPRMRLRPTRVNPLGSWRGKQHPLWCLGLRKRNASLRLHSRATRALYFTKDHV